MKSLLNAHNSTLTLQYIVIWRKKVIQCLQFNFLGMKLYSSQ